MSPNSSDLHSLKLCPFENLQNKYYVCYKNEKCCPQGCCSTDTFNYFQSWVFWLLVILTFILFYSIVKCCKKLEVKRTSRASVEPDQSPTDTQNVALRTDEFVGELINYFLIGDRNRNQLRNVRTIQSGNKINTEPPPDYNEALCMPKVETDSHVVEIHSHGSKESDLGNGDNEVLPSYEAAVQREANT